MSAIVVLDNGVVIPAHYNDRYYVADCSKCGCEEAARTTAELKVLIQNHICRQ